MDQRFACRFFIALFLVCCFTPLALAQKEAEDLERAFAATFALVPEVARFHAGFACSKHGQQAVQVVRARDSGMGQAAALALLAPPQPHRANRTRGLTPQSSLPTPQSSRSSSVPRGPRPNSRARS